jgi:putative DNA primase/helicase
MEKELFLEELIGVSGNPKPAEGTNSCCEYHDHDKETTSQEGYHFTDLGNARRLVYTHGKDLRHCESWEKWLAWDARRWETNNTEARRRATAVVDAVNKEAEALVLQDPEDGRAKAYLQWARASENRGRLSSMLWVAQSEPGIAVLPEQLDANPWLLNCLNGTLDLRTGELLPHQRENLITKLAPVRYDGDAQAPTWERFLVRITGEDQELIEFLQRAVGYSITGFVGEHCLFVLHGKGRNGKSTFLNALMGMLGDYAHKANPGLLMAHRMNSHPTEKGAVLYGHRFVPTIESGEGRKLDEVAVKELTGGDMVVTRRMREDFWQFTPVHHLWLATNHKPVIRGGDEGIWSRIRLVPFAVTIPPEDRDEHLTDKLRLEWPGILAWAVQGCLKWQRDRLGAPIEVVEATQEYRQEMGESDNLADFLRERCELGPRLQVKSSELYAAYRDWCESNSEKPLSRNELTVRLAEREGMTKTRVGHKGERALAGIALAKHSIADADDC